MKKIRAFRNRKLVVISVLFLLATIWLIYLLRHDGTQVNVVSFGWSEVCDGKIYTQSEKEKFCDDCLKGGDCSWPLDMDIELPDYPKARASGSEIHCHIIADGIDHYTEFGRYYGITNSSLFTWIKLPADKAHKVEFCCKTEGENILSSIFPAKIACADMEVDPRC